MPANKVVRIKVWGDTKDHSAAEILGQVKAATAGVRFLEPPKELGQHGDETRPQPHDAEGKGAVCGAVLKVTETELEKLMPELSKIANIQVDVEEAA